MTRVPMHLTTAPVRVLSIKGSMLVVAVEDAVVQWTPREVKTTLWFAYDASLRVPAAVRTLHPEGGSGDKTGWRQAVAEFCCMGMLLDAEHCVLDLSHMPILESSASGSFVRMDKRGDYDYEHELEEIMEDTTDKASVAATPNFVVVAIETSSGTTYLAVDSASKRAIPMWASHFANIDEAVYTLERLYRDGNHPLGYESYNALNAAIRAVLREN